ncbi:hypothetical protein [Ruminococcus sp.]|uniref:hypothetical protein n=1 Tax=Ruminococcus sp. TaxID=41978 RepID=UPI0025E7B59B|nr:hypothetical protein [Ruminococcus sp.]
MGEQFWWFYDVIVAAVVLICIFLTVRKGILKASAAIVAYIFAVFISFSLSTTFAERITESALYGSNVKKMNYTISENDYAAELSSQLNGLGYYIKVDRDKIEEFYLSGEDVDNKIYTYIKNMHSKQFDDEETFLLKLHNCYAVSASNFIAKKLSPYSAEYAAEQIRNNPEKYWQFMKLLSDDYSTKTAAEFLVRNYIQPPYTTLIRLVIYIIAFVILLIIFLLIAHSFSRNDHTENGFFTIFLRIIIGIGKAAAIILAIAVLVRLNVITGDNKMLFFNHEAIDKTYIFKYFYSFIRTW